VLRKTILMMGAILMLWASSAAAQQKFEVGHCVADLKKLCPGIEPGGGSLQACMREHLKDLSTPA